MLTSSQKSTLKAAFLADANVNTQPNNSDGHFFVAAYYNQTASPAFIVWRASVTMREIKQAITWTEYIAMTVGARSAFELITRDGTVNAGDANIRQGFLDILSSAPITRAALTAIAKRSATRGEKVLATGTGSDAAPATMTFEGLLSGDDVDSARNS